MLIRFYNVVMEITQENKSASQLATNFDYIEPAVVELGSVQGLVNASGAGMGNDATIYAS